MYPTQTAQGVRFHMGEDLLTKATPRNADILSIKKSVTCLDSDAVLPTTLSFFSGPPLRYGFSILK